MLTKNQVKFITNLRQKKHRDENNLFFVEGIKGTQELLKSHFELINLFSTENFIKVEKEKFTLITKEELTKISNLSTPNTCLAIFKKSKPKKISEKGIILCLDNLQDPGNFGTIIRLCDWFGIENLVCSYSSVDMYNPKVIQATMGSISRVNITYTDICTFLKNTQLPIYGTFLNGKNIYSTNLSSNAVIVMGNEANGISPSVEKLIQERITIPKFGKLKQTESLNVATATAITLSEFFRSSMI